jgi:periplasmic protein TonB
MTHSLGVRATSMAASSAILGLLVLAALSVTYTVQQLHFPSPPHAVTVVQEAPPPPIEPAHPTPPPLSHDPQTTEDPFVPPELPPAFVDASASAGETFTPTPPLTITNPHWRQRPRDLERYYPRRAMANSVQGQVVLDCRVDAAGLLDCRVVSETPANWGFGEAALRISRDYAMVPATRDGQVVEARYRMRVPFDLR